MKSALDELLEEGFAKGLEKGVQGQRDLLRRLLVQRFGEIPPDLDARLAVGTPAEIATWGARILTARSPADVLAS